MALRDYAYRSDEKTGTGSRIGCGSLAVMLACAHRADTSEYARLLKAEGHCLGTIAAETGIPTTFLHRNLPAEPLASEVSS